MVYFFLFSPEGPQARGAPYLAFRLSPVIVLDHVCGSGTLSEEVKILLAHAGVENPFHSALPSLIAKGGMEQRRNISSIRKDHRAASAHILPPAISEEGRNMHRRIFFSRQERAAIMVSLMLYAI